VHVGDAGGFYIITACTGMQAARETELVPGLVMGHFTAALVNGIESGAADLESTGEIRLSDLRHYLGQVVIGSTPLFFDHKARGDPLISLSPATAARLLDAELLADLDDEQRHRRRGAVSVLSDVLRDGDAAARAEAKAALQRRLGKERDDSIRAELKSALGLESVDAPPSVSHNTHSNPLWWRAPEPDAVLPDDPAAVRQESLRQQLRNREAVEQMLKNQQLPGGGLYPKRFM
jgi:hypothetical protein